VAGIRGTSLDDGAAVLHLMRLRWQSSILSGDLSSLTSVRRTVDRSRLWRRRNNRRWLRERGLARRELVDGFVLAQQF
jgi:hypothetical protein